MADSTNGAPAGHPTVTPYLMVKGATEAMDYYIRLFDGVEVYRMSCPQTGKVMHGEIRIGNSLVYVSEACPEYGNNAPGEHGSPVAIHVYLPDVDATHDAAVASGATSLMPPTDMFWGDRFTKIRDPFGHIWTMATHKEDLTPEQVQERMEAAFAAPAAV